MTTEAEAAIMASTAQKFEDVNSSLQTLLSNLLSELDALKGAWAGQSARSFDSVKQAFEANQLKLAEALRQTAGGIRTSGEKYTAADDETSASIGNINTTVNLAL
jgi:WXG100 family type VII secretion target